MISRFPSLFSKTCLQVHNCTKCRQCLPGCFHQERAPKDGETCSEVLLAVPCCAGTLVSQRVPCRGPSGPVVNELIGDRRGVGHASAPMGSVGDLQTAGHALALPWSTGEAEREPVCDQHGVGHASAPKGSVGDLQMAGQASELPRSTGSAECRLPGSANKARDRLFAYLNGQQVGIGSEELMGEWWSNPNRGDDHMSDLMHISCTDNEPNDIDNTLMQISISGSADLQRQIRLLCREYGDIFSPTVRAEPVKVPPLSMMVDRSKWAGKKNRGTPSFLTRDKDVDLRKQSALLESLGVIEKSTASEYSQVHLVRKPDNGWRLCIDFKNLNDATESLETWPFQNIPIMVDRVTRQRPRLYGKMDMTSGFFQAAIDER